MVQSSLLSGSTRNDLAAGNVTAAGERLRWRSVPELPTPNSQLPTSSLRLLPQPTQHCVHDGIVPDRTLLAAERAVGAGVAQRARVGGARNAEVARQLLQ